MKIFFQDLALDTQDKIVLETMEKMAEEKKEKPKPCTPEWEELFEEAQDRVNRNNFGIEIDY